MKRPTTLHKKVVIYITYKPGGVSGDKLEDILHTAVSEMAGNGGFTGTTKAEVQTWSCEVFSGKKMEE